MIIADIYYLIKHIFSKDKCICPRCGNDSFEHGFRPEEEHFCTKCHLWEEYIGCY